ncbi:hypothetical protein GCM10009827_077620 [Dactylosporangium maewongense]|uniref:RNA polymerase sigma-70 region 2 domain-containing protein n=1 Tax=Dactylosporangium maewongense TaxID=634393 RepID=A0ABP4MJW4_9ACTN
MAAEEFQDFVEVRYGDLLRTAFLLTGSRHAAEDLLQSSLLKVMRHWDRVDEPFAYVRRVMVNQRTSIWRRLRNAEVLTGDPPDRPGPIRSSPGGCCWRRWTGCRRGCVPCWCCGTGRT